MQTAIVIRCQNGVVVWTLDARSKTDQRWRCSRDAFEVAAPMAPAQIEAALVSIAAHSQALAGAILQVAQLQI